MIFLRSSLSLQKTERQRNFQWTWGLIWTAALVTTFMLSSCAVIDSILTTPTPVIPTQTPLPTATTVWFLPTLTPTPQFALTQAPTPEMRPDIGDMILRDNFSKPGMWDTATSNEASANFVGSRLTLAARNHIYIFSLRHETFLDNFYAEITAQPSLCRDKDSYGVLIRASAGAYYRFALSCDGSVSAERLSGRSREVLQKPIISGDTPPGAGDVRIGIWARNEEMRLFLNGRYQFSVSNANNPAGTIGVFVNSAGETPTVISFFDLNIREVR
jgi:hypothetical protein